MKYSPLIFLIIFQFSQAKSTCQSQNLLPLYSQAVEMSARVTGKSLGKKVTVVNTDFSAIVKKHLHVEFGDETFVPDVCQVDGVTYDIKEKDKLISGEFGAYEMTFLSPESAENAEQYLLQIEVFNIGNFITDFTWERRNQTILVTFYQSVYRKK